MRNHKNSTSYKSIKDNGKDELQNLYKVDNNKIQKVIKSKWPIKTRNIPVKK